VACFVENFLLIYSIKAILKIEIAKNWDNFSIPVPLEKKFVARLAGRRNGAYRAKKNTPCAQRRGCWSKRKLNRIYNGQGNFCKLSENSYPNFKKKKKKGSNRK
jgi:hypothetical protein